MIFALLIACTFVNAQVTYKCEKTKVTIEGTGICGSYSADNGCPQPDEITEIVIGDGITELSQDVFKSVKKLNTLKIGTGLTKIGDNCFNTIDYTNFALDITIPANVKKIGNNVLQNAKGLSHLYLEATELEIGDQFCENTEYLSEMSGNGKVKKIGNNAFKNSPICILVFTGDNAEIGSQFCQNAERLEKITISGTIKSIGENAFQNAVKKEVREADLKIDAEIGTVADGFFENAEKLKKIEITKKIEKIGNNAFKQATKQAPGAELKISGKIDEIGNSFFENAEGLKTVEITETIKKVGTNPFQNAKNIEKFTYKGEKPTCATTNEVTMKQNVVVDIPKGFCLKPKAEAPPKSPDASVGTMIMMFAMIFFFLF